MWKQTGKKPAQLVQLQQEELPEHLEYLWEWYTEELFNGGRLTWTELDAWARLTRRQPTPHEVEALKTLDTIFLRVQHDRSSGPPNQGTDRRRS